MPEHIHIPGLIDTRPNPLEVLGITVDTARRLSLNGLGKAVRRMSEVWMLDTHPDANQGQTDPHLAAVYEAKQRIDDEGLEEVKKQYLATRAKKKAPNPVRPWETPAIERGNSWYLLNELLEGQYRPEAISQLPGFVVVASDYHNHFIGGERQLAVYSYTRLGRLTRRILHVNTHPLPPELERLYPRDNSTNPFTPDILRVEEGLGRSFRGEGILPLHQLPALPMQLENGWYEIRGTETSDTDKRSVLSLHPAAREETMRYIPVGCLAPEAWQAIVNYRLNPAVRKRRDALVGGQDQITFADSPASFDEIHLSFDLSTLSDAFLNRQLGENAFSCNLIPQWVLLGFRPKVFDTRNDHAKSLLPLGVVQFGVTHHPDASLNP